MSVQLSASLHARELVLDPLLLNTIVSHLRAARPWEGVGLLATTQPIGDAPIHGVRFFPGANVAQSPTRFQMDPRDVLHAIQAIRDNGWYLGAIVHSHLYGPATPSATDMREAHYPESWMLIASFVTDPPEIRLWCVDGPEDGRTATEVPFVVREDTPAW